MSDKLRDISPPLKQGGYADPEHVQPVIEVPTKIAKTNSFFQIAIGCRYDARPETNAARAADGPYLVFLKCAEQLCLAPNREFPNFVKKHRSTIGRLKQPVPREFRPAESASHMAEQFALDQGRHQRRAINGDKWSITACAAIVDCTGDQLFANARFTDDQHGTRRGTCLGDFLAQFHRWR